MNNILICLKKEDALCNAEEVLNKISYIEREYFKSIKHLVDREMKGFYGFFRAKSIEEARRRVIEEDGDAFFQTSKWEEDRGLVFSLIRACHYDIKDVIYVSNTVTDMFSKYDI